MVEVQALGDDLGGVVGAVLQRGPGEQSAREFGVACLQVQRHVPAGRRGVRDRFPAAGDSQHYRNLLARGARPGSKVGDLGHPLK